MSTIKIQDDGVLYVNGARVDALVKSQDVSGAVLMEREATENTSGKTTQFTGYDDTKIVLQLLCVTDNKYKAIATITNAFKKIEGGVPAVYTLDFRVAKAMNVSRAIISDMSVRKGSGRQDVTVTVTLTEVDPPVENIQKQQKQQLPTVQVARLSEREIDATTKEVILTEEDTRRYAPRLGGV